MAKPVDSLRVNERLYRQIARVLDDLEQRSDELTLRERVQALVAVGRIQTIFVTLRKEHQDDANAGATVRKYAGAFAAKSAAHGTRRRKTNTRPAPEPEPADPILSWADDDDRDDGAA